MLFVFTFHLYLIEESLKTALATRLRALESAAAVAEEFERCVHCSAKMRRRSKLEFVADKVRRGEETNTLLVELFEDEAVTLKLARPEFHRVNSCVGFRKEATESMALVHELRRLRSTMTPIEKPYREVSSAAGDPWCGWHLIDLCSGASLTVILYSIINLDSP